MRASFADIIPLVCDTLQQGGRVRLAVTGMSMRPFIRSGDIVELAAVTASKMTVGIVVLVKNKEGGYLLHRLTRLAPDAVFTRGDAHFHEEGPFTYDRILAQVTGVVRGDCVVPLDAGTRGLLARMWNASPVGFWLLKTYECSRRAGGRVLRSLGLRRFI